LAVVLHLTCCRTLDRIYVRVYLGCGCVAMSIVLQQQQQQQQHQWLIMWMRHTQISA